MGLKESKCDDDCYKVGPLNFVQYNSYWPMLLASGNWLYQANTYNIKKFDTKECFSSIFKSLSACCFSVSVSWRKGEFDIFQKVPLFNDSVYVHMFCIREQRSTLYPCLIYYYFSKKYICIYCWRVTILLVMEVIHYLLENDVL